MNPISCSSARHAGPLRRTNEKETQELRAARGEEAQSKWPPTQTFGEQLQRKTFQALQVIGDQKMNIPVFKLFGPIPVTFEDGALFVFLLICT